MYDIQHDVRVSSKVKIWSRQNMIVVLAHECWQQALLEGYWFGLYSMSDDSSAHLYNWEQNPAHFQIFKVAKIRNADNFSLKPIQLETG